TLLDSMADSLHVDSTHDTSMIVYGLKRAGKTSVVKRFIEHTLAEKRLDNVYVPIYTDGPYQGPASQAIKEEADLLAFLMRIIVEGSRAAGIDPRFTPTQFLDDFKKSPFETFAMLME